jgi:hypothetical protein
MGYHLLMRRALTILVLLLGAGCAAMPVGHGEAELDFSPAYEAVEGPFLGSARFIDERTGTDWVSFSEIGGTEGWGVGFAPCSAGSVKCLQSEGWPPLLSSLPSHDFLGGSFTYAAVDVDRRSNTCSEITATAGTRQTTSIVCPVVGLVEFQYRREGRLVEKYILKGMTGLFGSR